MDSSHSEKQPSQSIPVVDRKAVDEIVINKNSGLPGLIEDFDAKHPELGNVVFREFGSQSKTVAMRVTWGAIVAGLLLEHSQQRVGGSVLGEISEDVVETLLVLLSKNSDQEILKSYREMFASQRQLFRGLDFFADVAGAPHNEYRLGGILMLGLYEYTLESKKFH